jgi:hypothetical protein
MGIGGLIEHNEACVDRGAGIRSIGDRDGMGMTAEVIALLQQGDVMGFLEEVGGYNAGHAASDHRHSFSGCPVL